MRVAVFVDGSNLYFTLRALNWKVDYRLLLEYCSEWGDVVDAVFYTGVKAGDEKQKKFFSALNDCGFSVISKPLKVYANGASKANLDVEIVLDMFTTIDNYDMAILISGDCDFERALQHLRACGKQFKVISSRQGVSRELRNISGMHFIDLENIRNKVERTQDDDWVADEQMYLNGDFDIGSILASLDETS